MDMTKKHRLHVRIAEMLANQSTCGRRAVGCILVDNKGHILSTGYNGTPRGFPHCNEILEGGVCPARHAESGAELQGCNAVHAEMNALMQCSDIFAIETMYCTVTPCNICMNMLLNTSCQTIYAGATYDTNIMARWTGAGREYHLL